MPRPLLCEAPLKRRERVSSGGETLALRHGKPCRGGCRPIVCGDMMSPQRVRFPVDTCRPQQWHENRLFLRHPGLQRDQQNGLADALVDIGHFLKLLCLARGNEGELDIAASGGAAVAEGLTAGSIPDQRAGGIPIHCSESV